MPTLIEAPVVAATNDEESSAPPSTADAPSTSAPASTTTSLPSKTPKKTTTTKKKKVTPGSVSAEQKKKKTTTKEAAPAVAEGPSKKQGTMMSFFGARKQATKKPMTPVRKAPPAMKVVQKPDAIGFDKESLREIVVGAIRSPLLKSKTPVAANYYDKHKGSPMPTNLKVPSITKQRTAEAASNKTPSPRCLLGRLNDERDSSNDAAPPLAQPTQQVDATAQQQAGVPTQFHDEDIAALAAPTQLNSVDADADAADVSETPTKVHEILALPTQAEDDFVAEDDDDDESAHENEASPHAHAFTVAPTQGGDDETPAEVDEEDEMTVCFSETESLDGDDANDATQKAESNDEMNEGRAVDTTQSTGEDALVKEVNMTHPSGELEKECADADADEDADATKNTQSCVDMTRVNEVSSEHPNNDAPMNDCIVDLTQVESIESKKQATLTEDVDMQQASQRDDVVVIDDEEQKKEQPKKPAAKISTMFSSAAATSTTQSKKRAAPASTKSQKAIAKTPKSRKKVPAKQQVTPPAADVVNITKSPERLSRLKTNKVVRATSSKRLSALTERVSKGIDEEDFDLPDPASVEANTFGDELSQQAVIKLALIVQGSDLPLLSIASKAYDLLKGSFGDGISLDSVSEKIKTCFTRENYISCSSVEMRTLDKFQDVGNRMWRWEIMSLDLLPDNIAAKVKKAQVARKKIRSHSKAIISLLRALDDADKVLINASSKQEQCDKQVTKVNNAEENVLKFERAVEKVRLMDEAKRKKEEAKQHKVLEVQKEKDSKKEDVAKKKEDLVKKKEELSKKKEGEKQKKTKEAEKKRKEETAKVSALTKNKARLMTFFVAKSTKESPEKAAPEQPILKASTVTADYLKLINSVQEEIKGPLFEELSRRAKSSLKRRTRQIPVCVDVTTALGTEENPFTEQHHYSEQKTILFPNKYKFLSFVEDYRPPYHGTWSKRSKVVTGKTPFRLDKEFLKYDEDSEAEWEEGDDEMGEDLQDEAADGEEENMDEEGDTRIYNFEDGWMAEDDDVVYENEEVVDDETKLLRKKLKSSDVQLSEELVAPYEGGLPLLDAIKSCDNLEVDLKSFIHVSDDKQNDLLQLPLLATDAEILSTEDVCLDAFPPNLIDENFVGDPSTIGAAAAAKTPVNQEMTKDDIKEFAEFVHHSTYASKDRFVEELRTTKPKVTSSRAQAIRKLDSIAVKKKNPVGGVIWEVKREVLEEMGLKKQLAMKMPEAPKKEEPPAKKTAKVKKDAAPKKADKKDKKDAAPKKAVKKPKKDATPQAAAKSEKTESSKKRKQPAVSAASAALFANFIAGNKKLKTS